MRAELQNYLVKKYPEFFEYLKEYKGPLMPISFGFECGDGWFVILNELMGNIKNHIENERRNAKHRFRHGFPKWLQTKANRLPWKRKLLRKSMHWLANQYPRGVEPIPFPNITQIKEKFGGLCFYISGGDDTIYGMISLAESLSYRTCEFCGTTKDVGRTQGWITTCCKPCLDSNERLQNTVWKPIEIKLDEQTEEKAKKAGE